MPEQAILRQHLLLLFAIPLSASQLSTSANAGISGTMCADAGTCSPLDLTGDQSETSSVNVSFGGPYGSASANATASYGSVRPGLWEYGRHELSRELSMFAAVSEFVNFSVGLSGGFGTPDAPGESEARVTIGNLARNAIQALPKRYRASCLGWLVSAINVRGGDGF